MGAWYATREDVKAALDVKETARSNAQIDRAIEGSSRQIDRLTHRRFWPQTATRYKDWPVLYGTGLPWRVWLDDDELVSVSSLTSGGVTIAAFNYFLEPANSGPPYDSIELDLADSATFTAGSTHQRNIAITGVFGYRADTEQVGVIATQQGASDTSIVVTWSGRIGVGDILLVGTEREVVTARSMVDSTQNTGGSLTASMADVTVAVSTGSAFLVGDVLLIDSERMLVVDIAGNNLTVKRAWDGSVLAAHNSNVDVYALTGATVTRGQFGTAAAVHLVGVAVYRHVQEPAVRNYCVALALDTLLGEEAGYTRKASQELPELTKRFVAGYARSTRIRAV
jgi:hypothetical protein